MELSHESGEQFLPQPLTSIWCLSYSNWPVSCNTNFYNRASSVGHLPAFHSLNQFFHNTLYIPPWEVMGGVQVYISEFKGRDPVNLKGWNISSSLLFLAKQRLPYGGMSYKLPCDSINIWKQLISKWKLAPRFVKGCYIWPHQVTKTHIFLFRHKSNEGEGFGFSSE